MMITTVQNGILQEVGKQHQDDQEISSTANQMPPQNLNISQQQQSQDTDHQMSQILVSQHAGIGMSMTDQHSAHSLEQDHDMLDLSEAGNSLEHLAGGSHTQQSLSDLTPGQVPDHALDSLTANDGRRQHQPPERISSLNESGNPSIRHLNNDRDLSALGSSNGNANNNLTPRPLSGLSVNSLSERQSQPLRNLTPVGMDSRSGQHVGNIAGTMSSDDRRRVGLGQQSMSGSTGTGSGLQDSRGANTQPVVFNSDQPSQNLLHSTPIIPRRGRPPTLSGSQHSIRTVDHQQHTAQPLPSHMRNISDHTTHSHMVDHHNQQQNLGSDNSSNNTRGDRNNLSAFGLDNSNGQIHSRPGSTLLPETSSDARDRFVYLPSTSGGRSNQSSSLIEETIAAVASNLNKSSPDGGIPPGPLPPNSLMNFGVLGLTRPSSSAPHLGHSGDDSLADLVGRHHLHSIPLLSDRASQSLTGLMDEHGVIHSPGHSQGRELEKTHQCLSCLKLFRSKQQLAQHNLVHTGIRKHICSYCDRAFKQLSHLQQHVRIHTGERKYVCQCCDRAFKQLTHLQQHYRIHTGEKPYRCKFENCERAFAQLSNLQHHMRNHDDQVKKEATRIHKCQICHRCYTNESSLKSHTLKMHIHIKPIDQHMPALPKKRRKLKNKDLYGNAPTMVPVSSSSDGTFPIMKAGGLRPRTPTSSDNDEDEDDDEIIFVGEQMGPPRVDNFGGAVGSLGSQMQMLQRAASRNHDLGHQIPFSGMGNFSRSADPLALLASANRFTLQENMMSGLAGPLNSFSDQLTFRDAALLNSRFGDLRGSSSQGASFDDRFPTGNFSQQQLQRDRDGFVSNNNEMSNRDSSGNTSSSNGGSGNGDSIPIHDGDSNEVRNLIPAHNQGMLWGTAMGGIGAGVGGIMHGAGQGLGGLMKQIKQEPLDYFTSSCHGGEQFAGMGVGGASGFLSPQHIINSHLRGQLPSLNVPLIRDHLSHNQMLPHSSSSSVSSGSSSTPVPNVIPSSTPSTSQTSSTTSTSLASLPLPLTHMGIYHQSHFPTPQRMGGMHPSPASTPSSQLSVGANLSSNLSSQGGRSPLEQEDLRCFSPLRN